MRQGVAALCLFGLVASTHAGTHQIEGRIVGVHDGDTITLLDVDNRQHKIRLMDKIIDCEERRDTALSLAFGRLFPGRNIGDLLGK